MYQQKRLLQILQPGFKLKVWNYHGRKPRWWYSTSHTILMILPPILLRMCGIRCTWELEKRLLRASCKLVCHRLKKATWMQNGSFLLRVTDAVAKQSSGSHMLSKLQLTWCLMEKRQGLRGRGVRAHLLPTWCFGYQFFLKKFLWMMQGSYPSARMQPLKWTIFSSICTKPRPSWTTTSVCMSQICWPVSWRFTLRLPWHTSDNPNLIFSRCIQNCIFYTMSATNFAQMLPKLASAFPQCWQRVNKTKI